jgi:hypothetical protein
MRGYRMHEGWRAVSSSGQGKKRRAGGGVHLVQRWTGGVLGYGNAYLKRRRERRVIQSGRRKKRCRHLIDEPDWRRRDGHKLLNDGRKLTRQGLNQGKKE